MYFGGHSWSGNSLLTAASCFFPGGRHLLRGLLNRAQGTQALEPAHRLFPVSARNAVVSLYHSSIHKCSLCWLQNGQSSAGMKAKKYKVIVVTDFVCLLGCHQLRAVTRLCEVGIRGGYPWDWLTKSLANFNTGQPTWCDFFKFIKSLMYLFNAYSLHSCDKCIDPCNHHFSGDTGLPLFV